MALTAISPSAMESYASPSTQLGRLERELEVQIKESLEESQALREKFEDDLEYVRKDAERRLVERNRQAKKQQAKMKEQASAMEREKANVIQQAQLLQEQVVASARDVCLARERIFQLESEAQSMRLSPPQVVERADPGTAIEVMRLRDKVASQEEQARRAQRTAAQAQEAVGRESAINQGLQRDVDNARHRLLTVQGSLAEVSEENAGLKRELEGERIKTAAGSRRLADAVERQDKALAKIRLDSVQLREQRDRLAQESAALGVKLQQLKRKQVASRLFHALNQARHRSLARALRALVVGAARDMHSKQLSRQQQEHASEVASLEEDVHGALARFSDARRRLDRLRDSRESVAELAVSAYRRRRQVTIIAAAAAEGDGGGDGVQRWCFWSWARVARDGSAARERRARRTKAEKDLPGVKETLSSAVERARGAEAQRDRHGETAEALTEELSRRDAALEVARAALKTTQSVALSVRNRYARLGAKRLHKTLEHNLRGRLSSAFRGWLDAGPKPEVTRTSVSRSTVAREKGLGTPRGGNRGHADGPPSTVASRTREAATNTLELAEDGETAQRAPATTPIPSVPSNAGAKEEDGRGATNIENEASALLVSLPGNHLGSNRQRPKPWPDQAVGASTPATGPCEGESLDRDHVVGGFPFPVTTSSSQASFTAPSAAASRPAPVTQDANASACNSTLGGEASVPVARPDGGGAPSANPDPPRVMLALRAAVGDELYAVGERLLRCVEADHREIQGKAYRPIPVTGAERDQFHACLQDATRGPLRRAVLRFLRVQESYRAVAVERERQGAERTREGRRAGHGLGGGSGGGSVRDTRRKSKGTQRVQENRSELSSLTMGPLSSPAEKARAARVLRDLTVPLLSDAEDAWARRRQPRPRAATTGGLGSSKRHLRTRIGATKTTTASTRRREKACRLASGDRHGGELSPPASRRSPCLDSGAGPRKFWETMAGPRLVDARWALDVKALEKQLWDLAILVREQDQQDGRPPLPLNRCDHLRRTLDVRIYEVLLLHVRTRMIWDGVHNDEGDDDGGGDESFGDLNENGLQFRSTAGVYHPGHDSTVTPFGWEWLAAAAH